MLCNVVAVSRCAVRVAAEHMLNGSRVSGAAESGGPKPRHTMRAVAPTLVPLQPYITTTHCKGPVRVEDITTPCSTPYTTPQPATDTPSPGGRWLRPLGYAERFMTMSHDYGCMTTVYALWLESRVPLDFEMVKHASALMYR